MTSRPVVVVLPRRTPVHEVLFLLLSLAYGLLYTAGPPPPASLAAVMHPGVLHAWAGGLLVSGALGLVAVAAGGRRLFAKWLEMAAMLLGAGALVTAGAAIVQIAGMSGIFGSGFSFTWAIANIVRAIQIYRDIQTFRTAGGDHIESG